MIDLVSILLVPDRAGGVLLRHIHPVNGQLLSQGEYLQKPVQLDQHKKRKRHTRLNLDVYDYTFRL